MSESSDRSLSLYFQLHHGRSADLEVVSQAAIEWVNSVRVAAEMVVPGLEVKVQLINAHEGSLSLNTVLDWGEERIEKLTEVKHPRLLATAIGLAVFLVVDAGPTAEYWLGEPDKLELTDEDRERIDTFLERISQSEEVKKSGRRFFQVLVRDPAVSSVGVCEKPGEPPMITVKSDRFAERSGLFEVPELKQDRDSERVSDVILETPDLSGRDRKWRFLDKETGIPFTAKMRDASFIASLEKGGVNENLRIGIELQIHIRFKEHFVDGEWVSDPSTIEVIRVSLG